MLKIVYGVVNFFVKLSLRLLTEEGLVESKLFFRIKFIWTDTVFSFEGLRKSR